MPSSRFVYRRAIQARSRLVNATTPEDVQETITLMMTELACKNARLVNWPQDRAEPQTEALRLSGGTETMIDALFESPVWDRALVG